MENPRDELDKILNFVQCKTPPAWMVRIELRDCDRIIRCTVCTEITPIVKTFSHQIFGWKHHTAETVAQEFVSFLYYLVAETSKEQESGKENIEGRRIVTREEIDSKRTAKGAWTKAQLAEWGVAWPPQKGWRKKLESGEA